MSRLSEVKLRVEAVEFLRLLKEGRSYSDLRSMTGFSVTDLSRYVNGKVLPDLERAKEVVRGLGESFLVEEIEKRIERDEGGYIDHSQVVFSTKVLKRIPAVVAERFEKAPDLVLTAAADGIPVAGKIADFYDVDCAYAKKEKETGVHSFLESSTILETGMTLTYYLPSGSISPGEKVLMVDDLIRTGHTQGTLGEIVRSAGADLCGVFAVFSFGDAGEELEDLLNCEVEVLVELD